jgi:hypothetical protein
MSRQDIMRQSIKQKSGKNSKRILWHLYGTGHPFLCQLGTTTSNLARVEMMKFIEFRGQSVSVDDARKMIAELTVALAATDPPLMDNPVGQPIPCLIDPRWYAEPSQATDGTMLCFRDAGLGWRAFVMPWKEVANLIGLLTRQMATELDRASVLASSVAIKQ